MNDQKKGTLLIVDDDAINREILDNIFSSLIRTDMRIFISNIEVYYLILHFLQIILAKLFSINFTFFVQNIYFVRFFKVLSAQISTNYGILCKINKITFCIS